MANEPFEKIDQFWANALKSLKEKKISSKLYKGFSQSVQSEIESKQPKKSTWKLPTFSISALLRQFQPRILAPILGVTILSSWVAMRAPIGMQNVPMLGQVVLSTAGTSTIEDDIAILRELGAWSDDEQAATDLEIMDEVAVEE